MGDYWYDFITQIPDGWIQDPIGEDFAGEVTKNGGIATDIPGPTGGQYPIVPSSIEAVQAAFERAGRSPRRMCNTLPDWNSAGQIAAGVGTMGDWKFKYHWAESVKVASGVTKDGVRLLGKDVRLIDMDGDGQADNGAVNVWWNRGPQASANNGWLWETGGQAASGVPHSNLETLRFADINGDGRADYVIIGQGGALQAWLNIGKQGGTEIQWNGRGGIATGVIEDISKLLLADVRTYFTITFILYYEDKD
ncbi:hypothetical protein ACHAQA_001455 [Verticillium albo-atrum]